MHIPTIIGLLWIGVATLTAGSAEATSVPRPLMNDFIGINGHTVQFKPELYRSVCRLVRDYHPVEWDLDKETSVPAPLPFAKNRVDWSRVYGSWKEQGWTTDACLMVETIPPGTWADLDQDAKAYGAAFAREFGPSGKRRLVASVEIGNEPGTWSDADYTRIFRALATGVRAADPGMKIASCNLTVGRGDEYSKSIQCIEGMPDLVDVLTIHSYAQLTGWPTWRRSYPEDPNLPAYLKDIQALCDWRDRHMPGKPVWITEFGYDSTTQPREKTGTFSRWEGVTDVQQAQWIVRSLLVFSAMPVDRAYVYFFNDDDKASLHASSGLTRHFKPKPSFYAVSHLQKTLGDYRFVRIVTNQPGNLRVHEYQNGHHPNQVVWAVWSPSSGADPVSTQLVDVPGKLVSSTVMPLTESLTSVGTARQLRPGKVEMTVSETPEYLRLEL